MNNTVLITGPTSGIGYELAKLFAKDGCGLVFVARDGGRLADLKDEFEKGYGVFVKTVEKDLSKPNASEEVFQELQKDAHSVDFLVNNAGFGNYGSFSETDLETELRMIQLNIASLTHLTKLFLKGMIRNRWGGILNVASTAAFQPGPLMAVYYASKAYVLSFSEALANELKGTGVTVTALCPGPTKTDFQKRAAIEGTRLVRGGLMMDAETVAKAGYRGLMDGKAVVVPGLKNKVIAFSVRLTPRNLVTRIVRSVQENKK